MRQKTSGSPLLVGCGICHAPPVPLISAVISAYFQAHFSDQLVFSLVIYRDALIRFEWIPAHTCISSYKDTIEKDCKMAALVSRLFWLNFSTVGRRDGTMSIFSPPLQSMDQTASLHHWTLTFRGPAGFIFVKRCERSFAMCSISESPGHTWPERETFPSAVLLLS